MKCYLQFNSFSIYIICCLIAFIHPVGAVDIPASAQPGNGVGSRVQKIEIKRGINPHARIEVI